MLKMYDVVSEEENDMLYNDDNESDAERLSYAKNIIKSAMGS